MINSKLLEEKIDKSGLKRSFICETLGISRTAFRKKMNGTTKFRMSEVYVLCDLLHIDDTEEKKNIFFAE